MPTNAHASIEEILDMLFMLSMLYQRKVGDQFFPELPLLLHRDLKESE
jgi:hypothetical protein